MPDLTLQQLVALARLEHPCSQGHDWQTDGARGCLAEGVEGCQGSQMVYRCTRCGDWDYGEPGGPGAADCELYCGRSYK